MAHENTVIRSINLTGDTICVDVFRRPDGTFGFDEYRRDPEDGRGWYSIGGHAHLIFPDETGALTAARKAVHWLSDYL